MAKKKKKHTNTKNWSHNLGDPGASCEREVMDSLEREDAQRRVEAAAGAQRRAVARRPWRRRPWRRRPWGRGAAPRPRFLNSARREGPARTPNTASAPLRMLLGPAPRPRSPPREPGKPAPPARVPARPAPDTGPRGPAWRPPPRSSAGAPGPGQGGPSRCAPHARPRRVAAASREVPACSPRPAPAAWASGGGGPRGPRAAEAPSRLRPGSPPALRGGFGGARAARPERPLLCPHLADGPGSGSGSGLRPGLAPGTFLR